MQLEKISQRSLSNQTGLQRKSILNWLNAKYYPRYDALIKLSNFFCGCSDYIVSRSDDESKIVGPIKKDVESIPIRFASLLNDYLVKETLLRSVGNIEYLVDFNYKTITIRRTIVGCVVDGKYKCIEKERTKTKKSLRTLPLMPIIEDMLLRMKAKQEKEREFFGNSYKDTKYIYVHEDGEYYNPNYITCAFVKHLKTHRLRHIRFHDLRHSCATLMRHEGIKMEDIQKWLGHSQLATTEKIYAHFEEEQHIASAEIISKTLAFK